MLRRVAHLADRSRVGAQQLFSHGRSKVKRARIPGELTQLVVSGLRAALGRVHRGHVAERLRPRIIAISTLSGSLKVALLASYLVLLGLALLIADRGFLTASGEVFRLALGIYLPRYIILAAIPVILLIATLATSAAIFANAVTRWATIALLMLAIAVVGLGAYPSLFTAQTAAQYAALRAAKHYAIAQLELPAVFLLIIAILQRRLPRWAVLLSCAVAFVALAGLVWRFTKIGNPEFAGELLVATLILSAAWLIPALFVVGADIAEWAEILGESTIEALPSSSKWHERAFAATAIAVNVGIFSYWAMRSEELAHSIAPAGAVLIAGLSIIFVILIFFPARSTRSSHFKYTAILAAACLILALPMGASQFAETDAPAPTRIFRNAVDSYTTFSIDPEPGWTVAKRTAEARAQFVGFNAPKGQLGFFSVDMASVDDKTSSLNEIIPGGGDFPPTRIDFSVPDKNDWMRFDASLTRFAGVPRGWLGIDIDAVSSDNTGQRRDAEPEGAQVGATLAGAPAAVAGIRAHDIITAVNGRPTKDALAYRRAIGAIKPGSLAEVTIWRDGAPHNVAVTVGELPEIQKSQFHFIVWKKSIWFERGHVDPLRDSHIVVLGACSVTANDCLSALESMQRSWSPGVRTVPSPWGQILVRWLWLPIAAIACCLIPWYRRRSDALGLIAVAVGALVLLAYMMGGPKVENGVIEFDLREDRLFLCLIMLIAAAASIALAGHQALTRSFDGQRSHLLHLIAALNAALLLLYLIFEALGHSSEMGEHSNTIKGVLVIAALTWEITASGSVTNAATRYFPRASRLLLFLSYILFVAVMVFVFFVWRFRDKYIAAFKPDEFILQGVILLGVPLLLAAFATRFAGLFQKHYESTR